MHRSLSHICVLLYERGSSPMYSKQIIAHQDLTGHHVACSDANDGHLGHRGLHCAAHFRWHALNHHRHRASCHQLPGVLDDLQSCSCCGTLHLQPTLEQGALRLQAHVAHHRYPCTCELTDQGCNVLATLQLHHISTSHSERCRITKCVFLHEVGAKRHVAHDEGLRARCARAATAVQRPVNSSAHSRGRSQHVLHGDTHGIREAEAAVPEAVAHKHQLHCCSAGKAR
mmetsp:Transcript_146245/g.266645  ORF Transcript_146245/g.266645 Transcript_146245/m.266645 type:complete len:228 (-) Transcript_146245:680-1363(-)